MFQTTNQYHIPLSSIHIQFSFTPLSINLVRRTNLAIVPGDPLRLQTTTISRSATMIKTIHRKEIISMYIYIIILIEYMYIYTYIYIIIYVY
jgi:hypothetical protein